MPRRRRLASERPGASPRRGFIEAYGLFWNANEITWSRADGTGNKFRMYGRRGKQGASLQICDFRYQRGIYVLYDEYGPYYVGLTHKGTLGSRLRQHRKSKSKSGRWDRFSWFGFAPVKTSLYADGTRVLGKVPDRVLANSNWAIRDLETLLIRSLGTHHRGNSLQMRFAEAEHWEQVKAHEVDDYLDRLYLPRPSRAHPPEPRMRW